MFFQTNGDYERVVDLGKQLGFALPASGLSLVQTEVEAEVTKRGRNKRLHQSQPSSSSTPIHKRSRLASSVEDPNLSEVTLSETIFNPFTCIKCQKTFASKYLTKKHAKDCLGPDAIDVSNDGKEQCEHCGNYFATQGGWLTRVNDIAI